MNSMRNGNRFETYEVICRKLENMCIEHGIYDEFTIDNTIHKFSMLVETYFVDTDSDMYNYGSEGRYLFDINKYVMAFKWWLTNEIDFTRALTVEGYKNRIDLGMELWRILCKKYNWETDDYDREIEVTQCLFERIVLDNELGQEYEIDTVRNSFNNILLYNEEQVIEMFDDFVKQIEERNIDVFLALEYLSGRVG